GEGGRGGGEERGDQKGGVEVVDRGEHGGRGRRERDAEARRRVESEQLTFKPKINDNYFNRQREGQHQNHRVGGMKRIDELARDRQSLYKERERKRLEREEEKHWAQCTFRPMVGNNRTASHKSPFSHRKLAWAQPEDRAGAGARAGAPAVTPQGRESRVRV
ncbi:unnamed protein product, partial [Discosporangium mesarthrocarpum]